MKFNKWTLGLGICAALCSVSAAKAQSAPINSVTNIIGNTGAGIAQVGTDGYNVISGFNWNNPISAGFIGIKNGSHYGAGLELNTADTNSLVNIGFGVFAIQNNETQADGTSKTKWGFYDATLSLSVQQVETIPVIKLPLTLRIESGPAVKIQSGGTGGGALLEQSAAFGTVTFSPIKNWPITIGGGVIHCSAFANVMEMALVNVSQKF
jgi:hypothetical protein